MKAQPRIGETAETLPVEDLRQLQLNRLREGLKRIEASVPFYREALAKPESTEGRPLGQPLKKLLGAPLNLG